MATSSGKRLSDRLVVRPQNSRRGEMTQSKPVLRPLLGSLVDYAGLFPPASLEIDEVVDRYARLPSRQARVDARQPRSAGVRASPISSGLSPASALAEVHGRSASS